MRRAFRRVSIALAAGAALAAFAEVAEVAKAPLRTVYVVRHAEKELGVPDPPLDARGQRRASSLPDRIRALPVTSVWSSDFVRTRSTAAPTADARSLDIRTYDLDGSVDAAMRRLADRLRRGEGGSHPLVVGHSNTVPDLLAALGVPVAPTLTDQDYGDLFMVTTTAGGDVKLWRFRFGDASP